MTRPSTFALAITDAEAAVRRSDLSRGTPAECADLREALRALIQAVETLAQPNHEARVIELEILLERFTAGRRADGTYNLSREAVEQMSREMLAKK